MVFISNIFSISQSSLFPLIDVAGIGRILLRRGVLTFTDVIVQHSFFWRFTLAVTKLTNSWMTIKILSCRLVYLLSSHGLRTTKSCFCWNKRTKHTGISILSKHLCRFAG